MWGQWCRTSGYHCGDGGSDPYTWGLPLKPCPQQAMAPKGPFISVPGSTPSPSCFRKRPVGLVGKRPRTEIPTRKFQGPISPPCSESLTQHPYPTSAPLSLPWVTFRPKQHRDPFCLQRANDLRSSGKRSPTPRDSPLDNPLSCRQALPAAQPTLARTFSKDAGLTREKQIRKTSWGGRVRGPRWEWSGTSERPLLPHPYRRTSRTPPKPPSSPAAAIVTYSLGVGERPQAVVVFLPGRVPQPQVDRLPVHHHVGGIVVETARQSSTVSQLWGGTLPPPQGGWPRRPGEP